MLARVLNKKNTFVFAEQSYLSKWILIVIFGEVNTLTQHIHKARKPNFARALGNAIAFVAYQTIRTANQTNWSKNKGATLKRTCEVYTGYWNILWEHIFTFLIVILKECPVDIQTSVFFLMRPPLFNFKLYSGYDFFWKLLL